MKWFSVLLLGVLASSASALNRIHDMRYTFGPEILVPNEFTAGGGFYTQFEEDMTLPMALKIGINDQWEMGSKLSLATYDKLESAQGFIDLGAKFLFTSYSAFQADVMLGLNNSDGGALVLSYTRAHRYTRNVSVLFEGRTGFFDAATGEDGWVMLVGGVHPQFQVGDAVRFRIGAVSSGSIGDLREDFMLDLLPQVEIGLRNGIKLQAEVAVGILQEDNNDNTRFGMYLVTGL